MQGVYNGNCGESVLDHAMTAVGYGAADDMYGTQFINLKNLWGSEWGEAGYMRISRNTAESAGSCGIYKMASYLIFILFSSKLHE